MDLRCSDAAFTAQFSTVLYIQNWSKVKTYKSLYQSSVSQATVKSPLELLFQMLRDGVSQHQQRKWRCAIWLAMSPAIWVSEVFMAEKSTAFSPTSTHTAFSPAAGHCHYSWVLVEGPALEHGSATSWVSEPEWGSPNAAPFRSQFPHSSKFTSIGSTIGCVWWTQVIQRARVCSTNGLRTCWKDVSKSN
jgi:hypothetical protein